MLTKKNSIFKIELLALKALYGKDCYGYEICTTIKECTGGLFDIKLGVMYPILYQLMEQHYISSYEEIYNGRARVYYHLEDQGREHYKELYAEYLEKFHVINQFLEGTNVDG